jgi:hypothetical protein
MKRLTTSFTLQKLDNKDWSPKTLQKLMKSEEQEHILGAMNEVVGIY